jgi:hypothetical protein
VKPKVNAIKAAAVGAMVAVILVGLSQVIGRSGPNDGFVYLGLIGIGGALLGVAVATFINQGRT